MKRILVSFLTPALFLAALTGRSPAQTETLGSIHFPTSAESQEAQKHFLRGVLLLHSFTFEAAVGAFQEASSVEPDFVMAYWGEALSHNHPLIKERNLEAPRSALRRLAPTRAERLARAPTEREKDLLEAVEILFGEGSESDRATAYAEAMGRLATKYPEDQEVQAFYSVSLLGKWRKVGDQDFRIRMKAGAVAEDIYRQNPSHPGAAHYVIHSFDDPIHAPLALAAAYRYAEIAPDAAHALHMPSHIFIQHGMWDRVADSNRASYESAWRLWQRRDELSETERYYNDVYVWHALDWGQYGELQLGNYEKAKQSIALLEPVAAQSKAPAVTDGVGKMKARYIIETEQWKILPITEELTPYELFATAMSATKAGDLSTAQQSEGRLKTLYEQSQVDEHGASLMVGEEQLAIMHKQAAALVSAAKGESGEALKLMKEATAIEETRELPNGAADPLKPAHELYGEILLEFDRAEESAAQFETSLLRMPNRVLSLRGLARAAAQTGDMARARKAYQKLAEILGPNQDLPSYQEAKAFISDSE